MEVHDAPKARSWFLGILMLLAAAYYFDAWLRDPDEPLSKLTAGIAFALLAPHAYLHPRQSFRDLIRPTALTGWLYLAGIVVLLASLSVRFWGRFA